MDYEKKYKEALKRAEKALEVFGTDKCEGARQIFSLFPELKESDDERIRKRLISMCKHYIECYALDPYNIDGYKEALIWLEKQGETSTILSNSSNIGNVTLSEEEQNRFAKCVLTSCASSFIDYLDAHKYEGKMCVSNGECEDIENAFHNAMWDRLHRYYCKYIEKQGEQKATIIIPKFRVGDEIKTSNEESLTITKIDEKGYWSEDLFICGFDDVAKWELVEQKSSWSEEDERICQCLIQDQEEALDKVRNDKYGHSEIISDLKEMYGERIAWLKSLKCRVIPQSRQEWSKEDETKMHAALAFIKSEFPKKGDEEIMEDTIEWLKSLKPQKQWKPSKGQLECLGYAIDKAEKDYSPLANNRIYLTLKALKEELEKLTE